MCNNNEIEVIENNSLFENGNAGGFADTSMENVLLMAKKAEEYVTALNKIMEAALKITSEHDWIIIQGKPYLQESGTTKVARLFGISIEKQGDPVREVDNEGYVSYTYKMRMYLKNQFVDAEGSRSMKQDFFRKKGDKLLKPDEIIERDVKMSAYTNCMNNGIKRLVPGLRNIDISSLENAGLIVSKIKGYTFKEGKKGSQNTKRDEPDAELKCSNCGCAVTQSVASFSQGKYGNILCMPCQKDYQAQMSGGNE